MHAQPAIQAHPLLQMPVAAAGLSLVLLVLQLAGGTVGDLAALLALPVIAAATFAADRRYLPTLLLLSIPALGVLAGRSAGGLLPTAANPFAFPNASTFVLVSGVEASAPMALLAAAFARVGVEILRGGHVFRDVVPRWMIAVFLVGLVPAFLGGMQGQALGHNRWSQGLRAMLVVGGVLWGVVVARRANGTAARRLGPQLAGIALAAAALLAGGLLRSMLLFIAIGFVGGVMPYFLSRRRYVEAAVCGVAVVAAAVTMTLTTAGEVVVALGCVALAHPRARGVGRWLLRIGILAACVLSALMIWAVLQFRGKTLVEVATRDEGVLAYAVFKLMGDRGPLWLAAVEQITGGPYVVVPAGRPLRPESFDYGGLVYTWEFGAHNSVLELLRNVGLVAGAAASVLIGFAILTAVRLLVETRDAAMRGVAAGFLAVALVGMTTGNYPVYDVGFFAWAVAGMLAGARPYLPRRDQRPPGSAEPA